MAELGSDASDQPDITMMLDLGVPRLTDMGLLNAGLSRATAMAVATFIAAADLTSAQCLDWLHDRHVETLGLPAFALREVQEFLEVPHPRPERSDPRRFDLGPTSTKDAEQASGGCTAPRRLPALGLTGEAARSARGSPTGASSAPGCATRGLAPSRHPGEDERQGLRLKRDTFARSPSH